MPRSSFLPCLVVGLSLLGSGPLRADAPGTYERGQLEYKMKSVDKAAGDVLDRYARWRDEGLLDDESKRRDVIDQAYSAFEAIAEAYAKALAAGMPATDASMAAAKAKLEELGPKFEPLGFWTCWRVGEPWLHETDQLDAIRRNAAEAEWLAAKGEVEEARGRWTGIDRNLAQLLKASKAKADDPRSNATAGLDQLECYRRTAAEVERLRAAAEAHGGKVDAFRAESARKWGLLKEALDSIQRGGGGTLRNVLQYGSSCSGPDLDKIEEFEKGLLLVVQKTMADFAAEYPVTNKEALGKAREKILGRSWEQYEGKFRSFVDVFNDYKELVHLTGSPARIRRDCAGRLADEALKELATPGSVTSGEGAPGRERAAKKLALGERFDPTHPQIAKAKAALAAP